MTEVIRIQSEEEFTQGSDSPREEPEPFEPLPAAPCPESPLGEPSIQSLPDLPEPRRQKPPDLEVLFFKHPGQGTQEVNDPAGALSILPPPSDPYNGFISTAQVILRHLSLFRECVGWVRALFEEALPDPSPLTSLQAWEWVVEETMRALQKGRHTELGLKDIEVEVEADLESAVGEVDRVLATAMELTKTMGSVERQVGVLVHLVEKMFKKNRLGAQRAAEDDGSPDTKYRGRAVPSSPSLPMALLSLRSLTVRSSFDGLSLKTGARGFWLKLSTFTQDHQLSLLSIFLDMLRGFGQETEKSLNTAQNLLVLPMMPVLGTQFSSVQALVFRLPTFLRTKKTYTPLEQVNGLRTAWKLSEGFKGGKADLGRVTRLILGYRDAVKRLYKERTEILEGRQRFLEGSQQFRLLVPKAGDGVDLGLMFDKYVDFGSPVLPSEDQLSRNVDDQLSLATMESKLSDFTMLSSAESLTRLRASKEDPKSPLAIPFERIQLEYEEAFARVLSLGELGDPEIRLCSDAVSGFCATCNQLVFLLGPNAERLQTALQTLESDGHKGIPGLLLWIQILSKSLMVARLSQASKKQLGPDLDGLLDRVANFEKSVRKHGRALDGFHAYVQEFLERLGRKDSKVEGIGNNVIQPDFFAKELCKVAPPRPDIDSTFDPDQFSIRISLTRGEVQIFSIPAKGSRDQSRLVKLSLLGTRPGIQLLSQSIEHVGRVLLAATKLLTVGTGLLRKGGDVRILTTSDLPSLPALQPFEKLALIVRLKGVLSSLARSGVIFQEYAGLCSSLKGLIEGFKLYLTLEGFPCRAESGPKIPRNSRVSAEIRAQFGSFRLYHYVPSRNRVLRKMIESFFAEHSLSLAQVVRRQWNSNLTSSHTHRGSESRLHTPYRGLTEPPPTVHNINQVQSLQDFISFLESFHEREAPNFLDTFRTQSEIESSSIPTLRANLEDRLCRLLNSFTETLETRVLSCVRTLHLPVAYEDEPDGTVGRRPKVGYVEALAFFIALAAAQLQSNNTPEGLCDKLRPKFFALTSSMSSFNETRRKIGTVLHRSLGVPLRSLEHENQDHLESIHGLEELNLEELDTLTPIPPPDLADSIWISENEAGTETAEVPEVPEVPDESRTNLSWDVHSRDLLLVDHPSSSISFEFDTMTAKSRGKLLIQMLDCGIELIRAATGRLANCKSGILEAARVLGSLKYFLLQMEVEAVLRPEQTYVIFRILRAPIVGVEILLSRTVAMLSRSRRFLSLAVRRLRISLGEIEQVREDHGTRNPFHYLRLGISIQLAKPAKVLIRDGNGDWVLPGEFRNGPGSAASEDLSPMTPAARSGLKFFESFGRELNRIGKVLLAGFELTHAQVYNPPASPENSRLSRAVGLAVIIGNCAAAIRHYHEVATRDNNLLLVLGKAEQRAAEFPNSERLFGRNLEDRLTEALDGAEGTVGKIAALLEPPRFHARTGIVPRVVLNPEIFFPVSDLDPTPFAWNVSIAESKAGVGLRSPTGEMSNYAELSTSKQVGILTELTESLGSILSDGRKTLEKRGLAGVKEAGTQLKVIKSGLKDYLQETHGHSETFDLMGIQDGLLSSLDSARKSWANLGAEISVVAKILATVSAYVRLRLSALGGTSRATYITSSGKNPHPRARPLPPVRHQDEQITRRYESKIREVERYLKGLVKVPLSIDIELTPHQS